MTTATKPTSAAERLKKLSDKRDKAHAELTERRKAVEAWDAEDRPPEIRPGSAQADQHTIRREQEFGPNPHREAYDAALATFTALDAELQAFKRSSAVERIAEIVDGLGDYGIRAALASLRDGLDEARADKEAVLGIVIDCPGLNGQDLSYDRRTDESAEFARDALRGLDEAELGTPGLTEAAAWKLATNG